MAKDVAGGELKFVLDSFAFFADLLVGEFTAVDGDADGFAGMLDVGHRFV